MYDNDYIVPEYDNVVDYRATLLKLFSLSQFNIDEINKATHELYVQFENDNEIVVLMKAANTITTGDDELGLMILHSYDYLYLFNKYLLYKKNKDPYELEIYENLLKKLKK
jgi:hypothetical protein